MWVKQIGCLPQQEPHGADVSAVALSMTQCSLRVRKSLLSKSFSFCKYCFLCCRLLKPGGQLCLVGLTYGDSIVSKIASCKPLPVVHGSTRLRQCCEVASCRSCKHYHKSMSVHVCAACCGLGYSPARKDCAPSLHNCQQFKKAAGGGWGEAGGVCL